VPQYAVSEISGGQLLELLNRQRSQRRQLLWPSKRAANSVGGDLLHLTVHVPRPEEKANALTRRMRWLKRLKKIRMGTTVNANAVMAPEFKMPS
jgi:hypothetical protein